MASLMVAENEQRLWLSTNAVGGGRGSEVHASVASTSRHYSREVRPCIKLMECPASKVGVLQEEDKDTVTFTVTEPKCSQSSSPPPLPTSHLSYT